MDGNTTINDLTSSTLNPNYPNNPTYTTYLASFEAPYNTGVIDYGQCVQGYLYPPTTGNYVFWISSADAGQLWLSTNSSPANAVEICSVASNTTYRNWTVYASQQSAPIALVAGQRYYIEALQKQASGNDNLSVAWMPPGGTAIPTLGSALSVTSLTCSGTTATATLPSAPGFVVGQSVYVTGATQSAYTGTVVITAVSGNTFSYTVAGSPTSPATGTITVYPYGLSYSGTTAIAWLPNNGYSNGQWIDIAGAGQAVYNGLYQIGNVGTNTFTYTMSSTPTKTATGSILANAILPIPGAYLAPLQANMDLTAPTAAANLKAAVTGSNNQISLTWSPVQDPSSGIAYYQIYRDGTAYRGSALSVTGLTCNSTTATATLSSAPGFIVGQRVVVSGASQSSYDGTFVVTAVSGNTFSYTVPGSPVSPATGTITVQPYVVSTTTSYTDTSGISSQTRHSYQVTAVNFDGIEGAKSATVTAVPAGIATIKTPATTSVQIQFTEPVDPTSAQTAANYSISGVTISTAVLQADGYTVTLSTSALGTSSHTLTINNVKTRTLSALPSMTASFTYASGYTYSAPPFSIGVNAESTDATSPALTGTISDPAASVAVRVNGSYYAAINNGDGTWSLPQGDISALGSGTYDVVTTGVNTSGIVAFDPTVNELSVGTASPTVAITSPASPTLSPVSSIAIVFSEAVEGFTLQDLQLTLANGGPAVGQPLEAATLTTSDYRNWTLGNLAGLTAASGTYTLTLVDLGSAVTDLFGNPLLTSASGTWLLGTPLTVATNPTNQTVVAGGTATFTAAANGNPVPIVQWEVSSNGGTTFSPLSNDGAYSGVTTTSLTISGATAGLNGYQYEAFFSNTVSTLTSSPATLTVDYIKTTGQPVNRTINAGQGAPSPRPVPTPAARIRCSGT